MTYEITIISTPFVLNVSVNCYLVNVGDGFVLIDTGRIGKRSAVEKALDNAGCKPGNLKLIVLTHGDFDHSGNAAYLREKFGAKIALHEADLGMVERGDFFWNRKQPNALIRILFDTIFKLRESDRFKPDVYVTEDSDLSQYGFDARVVYLPGHSKGSIGVLTANGDLFCGDLLANTSKPDIWSIKDDAAAMNASAEKLNGLKINTVYPGHGKPFPMEAFLKNQQRKS